MPVGNLHQFFNVVKNPFFGFFVQIHHKVAVQVIKIPVVLVLFYNIIHLFLLGSELYAVHFMQFLNQLHRLGLHRLETI